MCLTKLIEMLPFCLQPSMTQYRTKGVSEGTCQSPTSPHSVSSYSPAQSPAAPHTPHTSHNSHTGNTTFSDNYYVQQQQQQTNALQHQFEQFNMVSISYVLCLTKTINHIITLLPLRPINQKYQIL